MTKFANLLRKCYGQDYVAIQYCGYSGVAAQLCSEHRSPDCFDMQISRSLGWRHPLTCPGLWGSIGELTSWNNFKFAKQVRIGCQKTRARVSVTNLVIMDPFRDGRNMKVAVASVLRMEG